MGDTQPAAVLVQGRTERIIYPVDPQLPSDDLTSRSSLPQMPFPVRKWSGGRAASTAWALFHISMGKWVRFSGGWQEQQRGRCRTGWGIKQHGRFFD